MGYGICNFRFLPLVRARDARLSNAPIVVVVEVVEGVLHDARLGIRIQGTSIVVKGVKVLGHPRHELLEARVRLGASPAYV
jgi:hypothetical protein